MQDIIEKSDMIVLRRTTQNDLDFVIGAEQEPCNKQYVGQWTKEQHLSSLDQKDILHLIIEETETHKLVGYVIMAGIENTNRNIEFRRIVVADKGKGFGRETLKLIKKAVFNKFNAHRLWLDVREKNTKAQKLYEAEGFVKEGMTRECILYNEQFESLIVMSILENEFNTSELDINEFKANEKVLESERLFLKPLGFNELSNINDGGNKIYNGKIQIDLEAVSGSIKSAMSKKLIKMKMAGEEIYEWYTYWLIIDKITKTGIGFIGFKGAPDENGYSEVGYEISSNYRRKGLMTEALSILVKWAVDDLSCKGITAKVLKTNIGSHKVLNNCNFKINNSSEDTNEYILIF
jgi:diamine N-acetyltransferase